MTTLTDRPAAEPAPPGFWRRYGALWKGVPRELAAIVALFIVGQFAFSISWGLMTAGIGLLFFLLIGVFVLAAALYVARGVGWLDANLLEWSGRPHIPRPDWTQRKGFLGWLRALFTSPHYWLHLGYTLLPQLVVSVLSFTIAVTCLSIALGGLLWPLWSWSLPEGRTGGLSLAFEVWLGLEDGHRLEGVALTVFGILFAFLLPYVTRGLTWAHWGLARAMLGAFRTQRLEQELAGAEASSAAAIAAEDSAMRRLERGLVAALESAAGQSTVPTRVVDDLPEGTQLPPELERNAYVIAGEALVNAVKHADATSIKLRVALTEDPRALEVQVSDDGRGGAVPVPGHGLVGLQERVQGLGGTLEVDSPIGGPTRIAARLPW